MQRRTWLLDRLERYHHIDMADDLCRDQIRTFVRATEPCFSRQHPPGHITASAWIVDPERSSALLVHHCKLKRWLQPGGHIEEDATVLAAARREVEEETGLLRFDVPTDEIFDLDIHEIPGRANEAAHLHYDVRFLLIADPGHDLQVSSESLDLRWFTLAEIEALGEDRSIDRMAEKMKCPGAV